MTTCTLVNGHVNGAIPKGIVFILRTNLNSLDRRLFCRFSRFSYFADWVEMSLSA